MDSSDIGACQPATHDIIFLDGLYTIILVLLLNQLDVVKYCLFPVSK